jgi:hypothetical protein
MPDEPAVRVVRSTRRNRTISARLVEDGTVLEVLAPAAASDNDLAPIIEQLRARILRTKARRETADDRDLERRARELNRELFAGALQWREIRYVTNQQRRFGSCTPSTGVIRISHRLATMPAWVRDYVLVHEMAHLREPNHGPRFWRLVGRYPLSERARGYLMASGLDGAEGEESDLEAG